MIAWTRPFRRQRRALAGLSMLVATCVSLPSARAQAPGVSGAEGAVRPQDLSFRFRHMTIEDGLSQTSVYAIEQDSRGFIWLGTQDGLNRFDGYSVVVYTHDPERPGSLSHSYINVIFEDSRSTLWVGTENGLNRYVRDDDSFERFMHDPDAPGSLRDDNVRVITEDAYGDIWVGTARGGLHRLDRDSGRFDHFGHDDESPDGAVYGVNDLLPDEYGRLWVATDAGLDLFSSVDGVFDHVLHHGLDGQAPLGEPVRTLSRDRDGMLWVGADTGLALLDPRDGLVEVYRHNPADPSSVSGVPITDVSIDGRGLVWVATEDSGLNVFDRTTGSFVRFRADLIVGDALHDDLVTTVFEDDGGVLWVGTQSAGAELVQSSDLRLFRHHPVRATSLSSDMIWGFADAGDGLIWVATREGLNLLDPQSGQVARFEGDAHDPNGLSVGSVRALETDETGGLWAGVQDGGLFRIDGRTGRLTSYRHDPARDDSLVDDGVMALERDRHGFLWVGTEGGLSHLDPATGRFASYRHDPADPASLGADEVRVVYEDRDGRIWVGTRDGGLNRFEPSTNAFTRFMNDPDDPTSLSHDKVWSIFQDSRGRFWVGTLGGGFNRFEPDTGVFQRFTTKHGLPNNVVYGIVEDEDGFLWLSTNNGLARFDPEAESFTLLDTRHGLQGKEFNSGAYYRSADGGLWFGGLTGANLIVARRLQASDYDPPVVLTGVQIDGRPVMPGEQPDGHVLIERPVTEAQTLRLYPGHRDVVFEFAALDYARFGASRYAYMLEGFDEDWIEVGDRTVASYTNVPPGRYTFRVRGSNSDGVWSTREAAIDVHVQPPFWRTWWFYSLMLLVAVVAARIWYRLKVLAVEARNRELEQQVRQRTAELHRRVLFEGRQRQELADTLRELAETKDLLVANAHKAGMAEIATGVLHNIGNLQNSIATSCAVIKRHLDQSARVGLKRANALVRANADRLGEFLSRDERGRNLPEYYSKVESLLDREHGEILKETDRLAAKIAAVGEVIRSQQEVAGVSSYTVEISVADVVDEVLSLEAISLANHEIQVVRDYAETPRIAVQKTKLMQVLINLVHNARDAMRETPSDGRRLRVAVAETGSSVEITVSDTGCGIAPGAIDRIFSYGFTTKSDGHGFGLHSSFNHATEMGGEIRAASEGPGRGATFTLILPVTHASTQESAVA